MTTSEARFTPSSRWCEDPSYWNSTDADATEHEVTELVAAFVRALQPELVVETGTNSAQTARAIGVALARNGHGRLVTLETEVHLIEPAKAKCAGLPVDVYRCRGDEFVPTEPVGFLWLDSAAHTRHGELVHYQPFLAPGAIVGVHDTAPHHPVRNYLAHLPNWGGFHELLLRTPRGVSFLQWREVYR